MSNDNNGPLESTTDRTYWAAERDPRKLASSFRTRIQRNADVCSTTGRLNLWARASRIFYGLDQDGGYRSSAYVKLEGAQGQDLGMVINLYRSTVRSLLSLIAGSRPSFNAVAVAYDAQSTELVQIANAIIDKALDDGTDAIGQRACVYALIYGEGWILTTWDAAAGEVTRAAGLDAQGMPAMVARPSGAVRELALRPDEIVRDTDIDGPPENHVWLGAIVQRDRWSLMAQYPQYAKEIHDAPSRDVTWNDRLFGGVMTQRSVRNNDTVSTYELYHRKTLALPDGLFAVLVGNTIVSMGPLPYDGLPFASMMSDKDPVSAFGYANSWDLIAPQTMVSSVYMQLATNQENFGRANVWLPPGAHPEPYDVGGARMIQGGALAPQVLDFASGGVAAGEAFFNVTTEIMQRLSGLNDATLGNAGSSASGTAISAQQQSAVAFNGPDGAAYARMLQDAMTQRIRIVQRFQPEEQVVHIAGKLNAPIVKRFKGAQLAAIDSIACELSAAPMRSAASRHAVATELLQAGQIQDPRVVQAFTQFLATGRPEAMLDGAARREMQCERLMLEAQEARPYEVIATMPHAMMIDRLQGVLADPSLDPNVQQIGLTLIQQHSQMWLGLSTTPDGIGLLIATGQVPHPGAQMMAAMQAPPMPPGGPEGAAQGPSASDTPNPEATPQADPRAQRAPSMSGEQSDVAPQPSAPPVAEA